MKNARLGDAFSQHRLGEIYLNGEFDTPKQAANALIWFEKAYRSYKTQNVTESISSIIEAVQKISLTEILSSPSAEFAWECFSNAAKNNNIEAQWQIGKTLIECDGAPITHMLVSIYFDQFFPNTNIREQAKLMLESVASSNSTHAHDAAVLLDAKRPVNEKMQLLWEQWLNNHDRSALQTAADLGFGPAQLTLGLQLARIEQIETDSDLGDQQTGGASLKKAVQWLTPHGMNGQDHTGKQGRGGEFAKQATEWQTPATDSFRCRGGDRKDEMGLDQQARRWDFPSFPDQQIPDGQTFCEQDPISLLLSLQLKRLNPRFEEWLMKFPIGWTEL